jgi:hypothetical protein
VDFPDGAGTISPKDVEDFEFGFCGACGGSHLRRDYYDVSRMSTEQLPCTLADTGI